MNLGCIQMSAVISLLLTGALMAQQDRADYEARLKAGREAAYKKFLLIAPVAPVTAAPPPSGASQATAAASTPRTYVHRHQTLPYGIHGGSHGRLHGFGDLRDTFYNNLNIRRGGRYADYPIGPYVFQPVWDSRYRRSWPRPMVVRDYVRSHWLWNGQRYTFVPGHVRYETRWITQGWPRYHWNGSHYSVSVSYR